MFFMIHKVEDLPDQGMLVNCPQMRQVWIFEEEWKDEEGWNDGGRKGGKKGKREEQILLFPKVPESHCKSPAHCSPVSTRVTCPVGVLSTFRGCYTIKNLDREME